MRLLFDANLSPHLVERLADIYPDSAHVQTLGLTLSDTEIWKLAAGYLIVSKDSDFYQRAVVQGGPQKVIWVRLGNCKTTLVESLLRQRSRDIADFVADQTESVLVLP